MLPANHIAFKEWAAIDAALGDGRQTLIVRKGGIHEGRKGFRVADREFWIFPTYVHEAASALEPDAAPLLARAQVDRPADGRLRLAHYAVVDDVYEIRDESVLPHLAGEHFWSAKTIGERFHYRQPGLFVLLVRVYAAREAHVIPDSPHFAGCRSWVELPVDLSTAGVEPVLSDHEYVRRRERISQALGSQQT